MAFEHLDAVLAEVAELGRRFAEADYRIYLVGGIVRDQWLDHRLDDSSDIDLTTDARPPAIKAIVADWADALWTQGEKFGTIGMRVAGRALEITTHRAESYQSDSRKPIVSFGNDVSVDLSRRDFTVNAMAIELPDGDLVDPWGGAADLAAGILRTPLSPEISFGDDPLRMLRAARFATKYDLTPDPALAVAATELVERIRIVAIERIGDEIERLLDLSNPTVGLEFLADTGLLAEVLCYGAPSLIAATQQRLADAIARCAALRADWRLRLGALGAATFPEADGTAHMCQRLRLSRDDTRFVVHNVRAAQAVVNQDHGDAESLRRWVAATTDRGSAIELAHALATQGSNHVHEFVAALTALGANESLEPPTFLAGETIMDLLGIDPGPAVGQAVDVLRERYYAQGPLDEIAQRDLLRGWWTDRATNA